MLGLNEECQNHNKWVTVRSDSTENSAKIKNSLESARIWKKKFISKTKKIYTLCIGILNIPIYNVYIFDWIHIDIHYTYMKYIIELL